MRTILLLLFGVFFAAVILVHDAIRRLGQLDDV